MWMEQLFIMLENFHFRSLQRDLEMQLCAWPRNIIDRPAGAQLFFNLVQTVKTEP